MCLIETHVLFGSLELHTEGRAEAKSILKWLRKECLLHNLSFRWAKHNSQQDLEKYDTLHQMLNCINKTWSQLINLSLAIYVIYLFIYKNDICQSGSIGASANEPMSESRCAL